MSSSLLLQLCYACLVRLTWIVFVMGGRWPYSLCLVGCCLQDLFNIARSILIVCYKNYLNLEKGIVDINECYYHKQKKELLYYTQANFRSAITT